MQEARDALDKIFMFTLILSVILFVMSFFMDINETITQTMEGIDMVIFGGYYFFFLHGLATTKQKLQYCKQHWILILLLIMPFFPIIKIVKFAKLEFLFWLGADTIWHILDELELL